MNKVFLTTLLSLITYLFSLITPRSASAQIDIGQRFRLGDKGVNQIFNSFSSLINALLPNIFVLAGIIFLILLIFAGLGVILSSGKGDPEGAKKAKGAATAAAIGLFLIFGAYWIIQIIQFVTGINIFNPNF